MKRSLLLFVTSGCVLLMSACGGDGPTSTTPPVTQPPAPQVLLQVNHELPAGFALGDDFTSPRAGTIEATVDYTFASSEIVVLISQGVCTEELFIADQCNYVASSFSGAKPRTLTINNAAAGSYTFIVGNLGPEDEAISMQAVLRPTASAANTGAEGTLRTLDAGRRTSGWRIPVRRSR